MKQGSMFMQDGDALDQINYKEYVAVLIRLSVWVITLPSAQLHGILLLWSAVGMTHVLGDCHICHGQILPRTFLDHKNKNNFWCSEDL